jgi:hypothetical protein
MTIIRAGRYAAEPAVNFWIEQGPEHVAVMAKHSDDRHEQCVAQFFDDGTVKLRQLHALALCQFFGIQQKECVAITLESD